MMSARFLFNAQLWEELATRVPDAKKVRVAVAYLGTGGSKLLPLRKGDELIVDMSLRAVRSGVTNPSEVRTLLRRGVKVFSRETLHAKFLIIDRVVIAGSSNISSHAKNTLDEAALLTSDPAALRRAQATFEALALEPVRKEYLAKCLKEYRPPRFGGGEKRKPATKFRTARVWIIGGLHYVAMREADQERADKVVTKYEKRLAFENTEVTFTHYPRPMKLFKELRVGDWLVTCVRDGRGVDVYPPAQFLGLDSFARGAGKRRYLLLHEAPADADAVPWTKVRKSLAGKLSSPLPTRPRTQPLSDGGDADAILSLWNDRGKWKGR